MSKKHSPHYLILGKNGYEVKQAVQLLLRFLLPSQEEKELALTVLDGQQLEEKELMTNLNMRSFFIDVRLIWIQQAEKLKKSIQDELIKYFDHPSPFHYLILTASVWAKNTIFYKTIEKEGVVLEFVEVKPWEKEKRLVDWVSQRAASERKVISYQVCQSLVKQTGIDQALLAQEFEKLMCYCAAKSEITLQDVQAICTHHHTDSVWQLGEALFRRDIVSALKIARALLIEEGQPLLPLLRQIRAQFQTEFQICTMLAQGKQSAAIAQEFPYMKGQILERHIQQARQYGLAAFKKGLLALDHAEMRVKNSAVDDQTIIELLMMRLG